MTRWICSLYLILFSFNLVSQSCAMEVYVSYVEGAPCVFCAIQLTKMDSISLLDFAYTDSVGYARFIADLGNDEVLVRASQFGYRDSLVHVFCADPQSTMIDIVLHPLSLELDEVTIIDKIALLKKSGDTTTFNLEAIETGLEISTFDIVRRFPGIEISGNKISYHGKQLDDILLGNIDVVDEDHVPLLESIRYDLIDNIQILENQNVENAVEIDSANLGLVMKVELKQKAKGSLLLSAEGGVGYSKVHTAKCSGVYLTENSGLRLEGLTNNSYNDVGSQETDIILNQIVERERYNNRYKSTSEIPKLETSYNRNNTSRTEREGKLVYSRNFKNGRVKSISRLTNIEGESAASEIEEFFIADFIINTSNFSGFKRSNCYSSTSFNFFTPKKISINIELPVSLSSNLSNSNIESLIGLDTLSSRENMQFQSLEINPNYRIEYAKPNTTYRLFGKVTFQRNRSLNEYTFSDSLFYPLTKDDELMRFEQASKTSVVKTEHQLRVTQKLSDFKIVYNSIFMGQSESITADGINLSDHFSGTSQLKRIANDNTLFISFQGKKVLLAGGLKQLFYRHKLNKQEYGSSDFSPYVFASYEINDKWNISTSFNYSTYLPNVNQLTNVTLFSDFQRLEIGGLSVTNQENRNSFDLSLFKDFETGENSKQFNLRLAYILPYTVTLQGVDLSNIIAQTNWQIGNIKDEVNLDSYYAIYKSKWNFSFRLNSSYRFLQVQDQKYGQLVNSISSVIKYTTGRFSYHSQLVVRNSRNFQILSSTYNNINFSSKIRHEWKKFSQAINFAVMGSLVGDQLRMRPILSIRFKYVIPVDNTEISLDFVNVNNLVANTVTSNSSTLQSLRVNENRMQSGNIMIRVKRLF